MNNTPLDRITDAESSHLFLSFCTFCALLGPKKINLANVFLLVLKEQKIRHLLVKYCDFKTEFDAIKYFLFFDSTLHKSKYIMKYLNSKDFNYL